MVIKKEKKDKKLLIKTFNYDFLIEIKIWQG